MYYDYEWFKLRFYHLTGLNLDFYKENQMKRRIETYILRCGIKNYENFLLMIQKNPIELSRFLDYITINVTTFFRKESHWTFFEENVLAELARKGQNIFVWSCACSSGEEPYSLAMSLSKYVPLGRFRILATDIDREVLSRAEKGIYGEKEIAAVPDDLRSKYFYREKTGWKIHKDLASSVEFRRLNLFSANFPTACDLIVCRNVLIYFTEKSKISLLEKLRSSLKDGGILFTGDTEQILNYRQLGFHRVSSFLYRRG